MTDHLRSDPNASRGGTTIAVLILAGVAYAAIGIGSATVTHPPVSIRAWRLAAWITSALVLAGHIGYEHLALHDSPRSHALRAAAAVALGGFGLAVGASVHRGAPLVGALILWPIVTAVPAFLAALAAAALLAKLRPRAT